MKKTIAVLIYMFAFIFCVNGANASLMDSFDDLPSVVNYKLYVDKFDDLGGTRILDSVTITFSGSFDAVSDLSLTDFGNNFAEGITQLSSNMLFQSLPSGPHSISGATSAVFVELGSNAPSYSQHVDHGETFYNTFTFTDTAILGGYIGPDQLEFSIFGSYTQNNNITVTGGGTLSIIDSILYSGQIQIEYDFHTTEIPEPSTIMLLGMGILIFSGRLRRKLEPKK